MVNNLFSSNKTTLDGLYMLKLYEWFIHRVTNITVKFIKDSSLVSIISYYLRSIAIN